MAKPTQAETIARSVSLLTVPFELVLAVLLREILIDSQPSRGVSFSLGFGEMYTALAVTGIISTLVLLVGMKLAYTGERTQQNRTTLKLCSLGLIVVVVQTLLAESAVLHSLATGGDNLFYR